MIIVCLLLLPTSGWGEEAKDGTDIFRMGISEIAFHGLNRNDAVAALKAWSRSVVDEQQLHMHVELMVFKSLSKLKESFLADGLNAVTLDVAEFMQLGIRPNYVFVPVYDEGLFIRYATVVRRDGKIHGLDDLVGKRLVSYDSPRMILARPWLQAEIFGMENNKGGSDTQQLAITMVENPSKAILQVFFGQAEGAVVSANAFTLACELNPQLGKRLEVLLSSPGYIPQILMFHPNYHDPRREKVEAFVLDMQNNTRGRQLLTTFQSVRMEKHPTSILASTKAFLQRYLKSFHDGRESDE